MSATILTSSRSPSVAAESPRFTYVTSRSPLQSPARRVAPRSGRQHQPSSSRSDHTTQGTTRKADGPRQPTPSSSLTLADRPASRVETADILEPPAATVKSWTSAGESSGSISERIAAESRGSAVAASLDPLARTKRRNPDADVEAAATVGSTLGTPSLAGTDGTSSAGSDPGTAPKRVKPVVQLKPLPRDYPDCPVEDLVVLISDMLGKLIATNDQLAGNLTRFHSRTAPPVSVLDYLGRLAKYATLSQPLLLSMVYYIDRLCSQYPDFTINKLTVHRFLITAATVAGKGLSDSFWTNSFYAKVGGVKVAELKLLELEFLRKVDWKIVPNPELLVAYYKGLVEHSETYTLEPEPETTPFSTASTASDATPGAEQAKDDTDGSTGETGEPKASGDSVSRGGRGKNASEPASEEDSG